MRNYQFLFVHIHAMQCSGFQQTMAVFLNPLFFCYVFVYLDYYISQVLFWLYYTVLLQLAVALLEFFLTSSKIFRIISILVLTMIKCLCTAL